VQRTRLLRIPLLHTFLPASPPFALPFCRIIDLLEPARAASKHQLHTTLIRNEAAYYGCVLQLLRDKPPPFYGVFSFYLALWSRKREKGKGYTDRVNPLSLLIGRPLVSTSASPPPRVNSVSCFPFKSHLHTCFSATICPLTSQINWTGARCIQSLFYTITTCTHIHTRTHTRTHTHTHIHIRTHTHSHTRTCTLINTHAATFLHSNDGEPSKCYQPVREPRRSAPVQRLASATTLWLH